jgi:hypothetical protein
MVLPTRNPYSWGYENPRQVAECHSQHRPSVNVWSVVLGDNLIAPNFIEGRLTAQHYRNLLENELLLQSEDVSFAKQK